MRDFDYRRPRDFGEAISLLEEGGDDAVAVGGGTAVFALMKERVFSPATVVDLQGISGLAFVTPDEAGVRIGALATLSEIERSPAVLEAVPFLADVVGKVASRRLRNQITLGGCLAYGETASDPPAACLALDALIRTGRKEGARDIAVKDFFVGQYETCLEPGEVIREILIPKPGKNAVFGHHKFTPRSKADKPTLGIAIRLNLSSDGKTCQDARVAFSNAAPAPMRSEAAEGVLRGSAIGEEAFRAAAEAAAAEVNPLDDIYCSGAYKREMVKVFVPRLLRQMTEGI